MSLRDFVMPVLKRWWLVAAAVIVATGSSYLATRGQPPIYQATTTLMVGRALDNPNPSSGDLYLTQQLANTYADMAQREVVRSATMTALGLTALPRYSAGVVPNTQLIVLAVQDTSPDRAQVVANELANQLIRLTPTSAEQSGQSRLSFINQQLDELETSIDQTKEEITRKQAELGGMFSARQIAETQNQISALQTKLAALQLNYAQLLQSTQQGATNTIRVIEPAGLPTVPIGPNKAMIILLAAAIGFVLAASAAFLLEYLDDTLKNPDGVQKALALPTLGAVPISKDMVSKDSALTSNPGPVLEAYNILRTNLQFAAVSQPLYSLLITSPGQSEGKTLTAAHLAIALAQSGQHVTLVDGDLRKPYVHTLFGLANHHGVTSALLQSEPDLNELLQTTHVTGLRILAAGPTPPNPPALLSSQAMRELLARVKAQSDFVIIDSPPATAFADAAILSVDADGVLLVLSAGRTRRETARRALEALNRVQARLVGVVLNRMPANNSDYYYFYRLPGGPDQTGPSRNGKLERRARVKTAKEEPA